MSILRKNNARKGGFMDEIRCDEPSYLIWKWHPSGVKLGESNRENSIRWGSSLRVKDGEVAVFVYTQRNGIIQDFIEGPFDQTIQTKNLPVIASIIGIAYEGGTPFQAEVYFINLARIIQVRFAIPFFDVYDPRFSDFGIPVAVRGTISFKITDYREFIKLHKLNSFSLDDFQKQIRDAVSRHVKDAVTNAPATNNIPVVQLESKTAQINDIIESKIINHINETFGVTISSIDIGAIEIDKTSDGYTNLMAVTRDVTYMTVQAQTAANIKNIHDMQRIKAENYAEVLRIQREEAQYAQHKQTQMSNFAAFQTETQADVGIAGAQALGKMGESGAGNLNIGNGGAAGFNPAAMMAGMALGGAVGQNIAGTMNNILSGSNQHNSLGIAPPPVPISSYYIVINGQSTGPFDIQTLTQMASSGQLAQKSLVWKNGMAEWAEAGGVEELKHIFSQTPPSIPK
ncbi:protein of unknown function [Ruminococcus flavefaciens]|uniref:Membrane protease subunit, stomatin/prohibitin family, contains C-terminal Zn-ribbon domain n=1 Tax=Ruminococcus flavefaciens TaxID=1265 RepID=A0A1H6ISL1_RUMFL|nr:SPFH domain-containing protein [Ruminococcus flavefaciens]SEH50692.1 protein of unknown function [Ruminococcus flavefaciens]